MKNKDVDFTIDDKLNLDSIESDGSDVNKGSKAKKDKKDKSREYLPKSKLRYKDMLREKIGGEVKRTAYSNALIMVDFKKERQDDSFSDGINPLESARKL